MCVRCVCVCVCVWCVGVGVWCGTLRKPPCVDSKRLRVERTHGEGEEGFRMPSRATHRDTTQHTEGETKEGKMREDCRQLAT